MHCDPCQFDLCDACVAWVQSSTKLVVPMESLAPPSSPAPPRNASPIPAAAKNTAIVGMSLVHFIQGDMVICITLFTGSFLGFVSAEKKAAAIAAAAGIHCSAPGCTNGSDPLSGILAFRIFILILVKVWLQAAAVGSILVAPSLAKRSCFSKCHLPSHLFSANRGIPLAPFPRASNIAPFSPLC